MVPMTLELNSAKVWVGEITLEPYDGLERTMVAITPTAPGTRQKASYVLEGQRIHPMTCVCLADAR